MIVSCVECPQYVAKEIEPESPAFCLYWGEGLKIDNPICRPYKEGLVPKDRVSALTDLVSAKPYALAGLAYIQSLQVDEAGEDSGNATSPSPEISPVEGRHLVKITKVQGIHHNFGEYVGPRARLRMEILEGPDAGEIVFDNVSLYHPLESKGMERRRLRIACGLGLIQWRTEEAIHINWKLLEGVCCWVDVAQQEFKGRLFAMVDNYRLYTPAS